MKAFIDTWGWISYLSKREARHFEVDAFFKALRRNHGTLYSTNDVMNETFTLLFRRLSVEQALFAIEKIEDAVKSGYLIMEWVDKARFEKAKEFRRKYLDKPFISFTDLTSMVVISELGISDVLTEDNHFTQVGMGIRKVP